jgi:predicted TIM-barrel fold metal-dependent hydrolase
LAVGVNPLGFMKELRRLESMTRNHPCALARVVPFGIQVAPSDASYYPLYARCIELDLALSINTGLPGPPVPGACQDPMHLDLVCFRFPELKLCLAHGADPWWSVAIRLMIKYRNLHLMTSAYSPKRLPAELLHFMNTRGQDKIIWASDHPALTMQRTITEAWQLDLREGVLDKYLYANADRLFFSRLRA